MKLLLAELEPSGGDVKVKVQGLQDQNRMMGALAAWQKMMRCVGVRVLVGVGVKVGVGC